MFLPGILIGSNASQRRRYARRSSLAAFAAALLAGQTASAQQEVWIGESNGLWSAGANWLDGTAPAAGGDAALALRFTNAVTATDDLAGAFALGKIIFDTTASTGVSIVGNAGSTLRFTGANPGIELRGIGDATIGLPLQLDATGGGLTISASGPGQLDLFGAISQGALAQPLTIDTGATSANASVVRLSGTQTFSGGVVLQSGNLAVASASALGTGALTVRGGTFSFAGTGLVIGNSVVLQGDLTLAALGSSGGSQNLTGVISGATAGAGVILRAGGGTVTLSASSTYTGATTLDYSILPQSATLAGGILSLGGTNGSLLQTSDFNIRAGSTLRLNGSAATDNRVADTTPIHLRGGGLLYLATTPGGAQQTETVGPVEGAGYSPITSSATTGIGTRLNLQSLARTARGTFLFRGTGLGGTPGSGVGSIFVNTAPPVLVGGGGTGPAISILPYAVGDTSAAGTGIGFVTYGATGLRPLNNTTEYRMTLASAAANENVRLSEPQTLNAARTVNALLLDGGSVSGTGTLTIASGALFQRSAGGITVPLDFGNVEANIFTTANLTLGGAVAGTNGLTKSGSGTLTLAAANFFTGTLTINAGTIAFNARVGLGGADSAIVINGHGAGLSYIGAGVIAFSRPIETRTGLALLSAGGTGDFQITAPIAGAGGLQIAATGGLTIALPAGSTYAGTTHLGSGRLLIPGDSALGAGGALNLAGGTLALAGNWSTAREINLVSTTLDTAGFDAAWSGAVTGAGTLTKRGAGELRLLAPSRFRGTVAVQGGTFTLSDDGALAANVSVASGGEFRIDHSATVAANRLVDTGTVTLNGGGFSLVGNAGTAVTERVGAVSLGANTTNILTVSAPGAATATLTLGSFTQGTGSILFRGDQLGGAAGTAFTRIVFANAPVFTNGMIPGALADTSSTESGTSLAFYNASSDAAGTIGVRALTAADYTTGAEIRNPANGGTTPVTAHFFASGPTTTGGAFNRVNTLRLGGSGSVALDPGQVLSLDAASLLVDSGAHATIAGGTLNFPSSPAYIIALGDLSLGSRVSGTTVNKAGGGTLTLNGAAKLPGTLNLNGGTIDVTAGDVLRFATVNVSAGTTLRFSQIPASVGTITGAGAIELPAAGMLTVQYFSGGVSVGGQGGLKITSNANFAAPLTFSGPLIATADNPYPSVNPNVYFNGDASALAASSVFIGAGARLSLDNATKVLARLGTVPIEISGGMLSLAGGLGGSVVENLGALSVRGLATFKVETGAALAFAGFTRNDRATLRFESAATLGGAAKVLFPAGLSINLVGAGTTATNVPILPFASGFDSTIGTVPVTFSVATGIRRLTAGELSATLTTGANVHIRSNPGPTNNAAVTVNSLVTLRDILGTGTITISSGFFGANGAGQIENGLSFGSAEANFVIDQTSLRLLGALNGSGGLTKSGTGALVLPPVNNIAGPLTINAGALSFATPSQLGTDSGEIVMHSGGVLWSGSGDLVLPRAIRLNGGFGVLGTTGATGTLHVAQPVTGPGGLNITGRLIFDNAPAYTGATMISGTLTLGSDALLGASPQVRFNNGRLVLAGPWNSSREVLVPTSGTLDTAGFDVVLSGPLTGSGVLLKTGAGRATIADAAGFGGRISIAEGAIVFDNADPLNGGRLISNGRLELAGGVLELLGNPLVSVVERISTLSLSNSTLSSIRLTAPGGAGHILNVETFSRGAGALAVVQADALGGGPGGAFTRIVQTTLAPASGSFVGGLIVADTNGTPLGLGVYDGTVDSAGPIGVRAARAEEYVTGATIQNPANGGSTPTTANFLVGTATTAAGPSNTVATIGMNAGANLKIPVLSQLTVSGTVVFTKVGPGSASIEGGALRFSSGAVFLTGSDLDVTSPIRNSGSGLNTFHKLGPAVLNLRGNVTGLPAYIEEGTVRLGNPDALANANVSVAPGATLDTASRSVTVYSLHGGGMIDLGTNGMLSVKGNSDFAGSTRGTGTLRVFYDLPGSVAFTPAGTLNHRGLIVADVNGSLVLEGMGRLSEVNSVAADNSGTISLRNTFGIPTTTSIFLRGGTLDLQPGSAALQLGLLTGCGFGRIVPKHDVAALQVDFAGLSRGPEGAATFRVDASNANLGAAPGPGVANLRFGDGFSSHLAGGPGVTPVIPFMYATNAADGTDPSRLVTYDPTRGLRMLTDAEYSFTPVPGSNYRLPNSGFTTIDTAITVNSLSDMTGSGLIVGDGSIEITGGVALLSDSVILIPLSFGSRQGHIMGNARIYAPISGTGGLTLSGGDISLGEANSFTGPLVINGGFIRFNDLSAFGPDSSQITIYNAGFEQEGGGTLVFDRPLRLGGGVIGFQGSSGSVFQFTAPITGPGGLSLQFSNSMSITGVNGYTGPTTIHTDLTINGDAAFGQSSQIFLESGSLKVTGPWTTSKPLQTTIGFFALDTNGFDISLLGPLSSQNSFPLTKRGLGRLTIANGAEFIGTLMVNEGTLDLRGPLAGSITAIAGTTVTGDGSVSGDLSIDGTLDPSVGAGEISAGTLQLETGATLHILLDSGTLFDRVVSLNAPSLGSNVTLDLQLAPGFDPIDDFDEFILIRNDSGSPISKSVPAPLVFAGNALDEGEVFYAGGQAWLFSYTGGSGNDVTIHAVPEPSIIATVVAGLAVLGFRRRHADR